MFITLLCLKCRKVQPLSLFGLRKMADGAIRNQPWCRTCRAGASARNPKRRPAKVPGAPAPEEILRPEPVLDPGILAAQVVAALHGGRR